MILPTENDFDHVTNLSKIDVGVDVLPNRTGPNRNLLYGKDLAVLMEHSGVRKHLLDGLIIRNACTFVKKDGEYEKRSFPVSFRTEIIGDDLKEYCPNWNTGEIFKQQNGTWALVTEYYKTMFPSMFVLNPEMETTEWDYEGDPFGGYGIMLEDMMSAHMRDMKLQMIAGETLGIKNWWNLEGVIEDTLVHRDDHGRGSQLGAGDEPFSYRAWCQTKYVSDNKGDGWLALESPQGLPYTITIPVDRHIFKAQLVAYSGDFNITHSLYIEEEGKTETNKYYVQPFGVILSNAPGGGELTINQNMIIAGLKRAIQASGHQLLTMDNVGMGRSNNASYVFKPLVSLAVYIQLDDHTKWW